MVLYSKTPGRVASHGRKPLYVWSDAYYVPEETVQGVARRGAGLGIVAYDPESGKRIVSYLQTPEYFFELFEPKSQYVGQLEALAVLAADMTMAKEWPGCMADRRVVHFVDNTSALAGLQKGYSSRPDTALLIMAFWLHAALLAAVPSFEYVRSKLNIADLASRGDVATLLSVLPRSVQVELVLPPPSMWAKPFDQWSPCMRAGRASRTSAQKKAAKRARGTGPTL